MIIEVGDNHVTDIVEFVSLATDGEYRLDANGLQRVEYARYKPCEHPIVDIPVVQDFIKRYCKPTKTIRGGVHALGSYQWKHELERLWHQTDYRLGHHYCSNGAFIAAALLSGYKAKPIGLVSPINCDFNMVYDRQKLKADGIVYERGRIAR